jgi:hypothetical protein
MNELLSLMLALCLVIMAMTSTVLSLDSILRRCRAANLRRMIRALDTWIERFKLSSRRIGP